MAEEHLDNPAGRLLAILRKAQKVVLQSANVIAFEGWAKTLDIPPVNSNEGEFEIFHAILEVDRLVNELEERITLIEDEEDRASFSRPIQRLKGITSLTKANGVLFDPLINSINEGDMVILEFCSRHLHKFQPEPVADAQELTELVKEVDDLFNLVTSLPLEQPFRVFLLEQIERIRRGLQEYRIGGLARLRETLGEVLGATMVHQEVVAKNKEADELKRFIEIADKLIAVIEFSSKTTKLIGSVSAVVPHLLASIQK